jgi:hypothetical protein
MLCPVPLASRYGKPLALLAAGFVVILFAAPLAWAGRSDPCAAAEVALMDEALGRSDGSFEHARRRVAAWAEPDGKLFSQGRVGRRIALEEHAGWPSFAACTALFWRARAAAASVDGITIFLFVRAVARR